MSEKNEEVHRDLCGDFDARDWAEEFNQRLEKLYHITVDEMWLVGWFANAIMTGYDIGFDRAYELYHENRQIKISDENKGAM